MKQESAITAISALETIENITVATGWEFERIDDEEIVVIVPAKWTSYRINFLWHKEIEMLYMACFADLDNVDEANPELHKLMYMANQRLWLGHFDVLDDVNLVFRHTLPLRGVADISSEQMEDLVDIALGEFSLFYPAFKHLIDNNSSAQEAFDGALIDTAGEA